MNTKKLLKELENRFGAEQITADKVQLRFLEERDLLFNECCWDFDAFVEHYQLIKRYGLEDKLMEVLAWRILNLLDGSEINELKESEFYKLYGEQKLIKSAFLEWSNHRRSS